MNVDNECRSRVSNTNGLATQMHCGWGWVPTHFKSGGIMRDPAKSRLDTQVSLWDTVTGADHLPLGGGRRQPTVSRRETACYVSCCIRTSPASLVRKLAGRAAYATQSFVDDSTILCALSALCGVQRVAAGSHIPPNGCPYHGLPGVTHWM
jgi:hypothetical protein